MERVPLAVKVSAVAAVALLIGFYVFGAALLGCLVWLSVQAWATYGGDVAVGMTYLAIGVVIAFAVPIWQILRARPKPPDGVRVSQDQAPELWRMVREMADSLGTRAPDEIRLLDVVNAEVWEDAGRFGLVRGQRYLYLGAPLLHGLTVTQIRAIVAHELGHYERGHTVFGAVAYRGGQSIVHTIERTGPKRAAGLLLTGYATIYFAVALVVMRRMEAEADATAVRIAGATPTRQALQALPRLAVDWEAAVEWCVTLACHRGQAPADVLDALDGFISTGPSERRRRRIDAVTHQMSRWDSHPPLTERLASIPDEDPDPVAVIDQRAGIELISDSEVALAVLRAGDFIAVLESAAQEAAERDAAHLYAAVDGKRPGLGGVLDILADGRGEELAGRLRRAADQDGAIGIPPRLTDLVTAAIAASLVSAGHATWTYTWSEPLALRGAGGQQLDLQPPVAAACAEPGQVTHLRARLREWGLDEAVTAGWAISGRVAIDPGPLPGTLPSAGPSDSPPLLLPDELCLLASRWAGRVRLNSDVFQAALAAAALAELRLRARVELAEGPLAVVRVCNRAETGDRFLDSVLTRIAAGDEYPAYQWLQMIGADVAAAVTERVRTIGRQWVYNERGRLVLASTAQAQATVDNARRRIREALRGGETDGPAITLGKLLWGTELLKPVLGRAWIIPRFWLGRLAAGDDLMVAIRTVIGLYLPLPYTTSPDG